ncbi:hypothetical protein FQN49_008118 [Arthroderma sp. PD_2]|nr:hypothetical protein FQN49_008118 [Arthroderma sp. PD_2]
MAAPIGIKLENSQPSLADIPLQVMPQQQPQQPQHPHPNAFEPNVNFDWDQWDAVFGQYLPIIDGYMDLDNNDHQPNPSDLQLSPALQVPDGEPSMMDRQIGGPSNSRNWADFG